MKVNGPAAGAAASASGAAKRTDGATFTPAGGPAAAETAAHPVAGAGQIGSLAALLALQETPQPLERRKRAVLRAGRLLDVLDEMKLALLDGEMTGDALERLQGAVTEAREATDDPKLEGVLNEIETRAAVELAKRDVARAGV